MPKAKQPKTDALLDSWGRQNRELQDKICAECGQTFRPLRASSRYCTRKCAWKNNGGRNKKPESWYVNSKGYIEGHVWLPCGSRLRIKKHRLVMMGMIGRPLEPHEDVHHKDGNKRNNRPENLLLITHSEHSKITNKGRIPKRGYKMNLSEDERKARSLRAIEMGLAAMGRKALSQG